MQCCLLLTSLWMLLTMKRKLQMKLLWMLLQTKLQKSMKTLMCWQLNCRSLPLDWLSLLSPK